MVVISGAAAALGAAQFGLGAAQSILGYQAKKQDYLNQTALQDANEKFAANQATLNAEIADLNSQYKFWGQTINYNQNLAYANSQRNVELMKGVAQAEVVRDTRASAGASYALESEAIGQAYAETSMQDAVALQQYQWRSLQARASVQARATAGKSIDRIVNNYARQMGDYTTLQEINQGLRKRQYSRSQANAISTYLSRYNSQQHYAQTPVLDPIAPFPPLPTLIQPPPPSMRGGSPGIGSALLGVGTAALGGFNTALGAQASINKLTDPGTPG
jgi:cell division protein FtsB